MKQSVYVYLPVLFLSIIIITIVFTKSFSIISKILITFILLVISGGVFIIYPKWEKKNKERQELKKKEKEENKKKQENQKLINNYKNHLDELKQKGLEKLSFRNKIHLSNVITSINTLQNDKIMITTYGGFLIIYLIDKLHYSFTELIKINEFTFNTYNTIIMETKKVEEEKKTMITIIVCGYPGIKIFELTITNENKISYKVIQHLTSQKYSNEIIKVIEINKNLLLSMSIDYLLTWERNTENNFIINKNKIINYSKYENLLLLSNIIKISEDSIVIAKQANSTFTKSSINFMKLKQDRPPEEYKIIDLNVSQINDTINNLCLVGDDLLYVGCQDGLALISVSNQELVQFISSQNKIRMIDIYFDGSVFTGANKEKLEEGKNNSGVYNFIELKRKTKDDPNDYEILNFEKKSEYKEGKHDLAYMKSFNDGIIFISDKNGDLQIWH